MLCLARHSWRSSTLPKLEKPLAVRLTRQYTTGSQILDLLGDLTEQSTFPKTLKGDFPPKAGPDGYPAAQHIPNPVINSRSVTFTKPRYRLHCHSTRNNTIVTLTKSNGMPVAWFSGGSTGFKKGNRGSYEAGYQCAVQMFQKVAEISKREPIELDLFFKGFGQGREALRNSMLTSEGEVVRKFVSSVTDRTPIKIGGTRAKKMRRL